MTERKTLGLSGALPSSEQLKTGLPIFYKQLLKVLLLGNDVPANPAGLYLIAEAASDNDEVAMANASGRPQEAAVAIAAGLHGKELMRLGYTLSHVVHAYGAICQSITELAMAQNALITAKEFRNLNMTLDVAIAGAVTEFQALRNTETSDREIEHLGFLAHELRNALNTVNISLQLIKKGTVGFGGSTSEIMEKGLKRIEELVDRSLTEVRLRVDPKVHVESGYLLQLVNQIVVTADVECRLKNQILEIEIDSRLIFEGDQQLIYSALSNLVQNATKYTRVGGKILVRAEFIDDQLVIEVEDECGGLTSTTPSDLFKPFEQQNKNRKGLGLGLTIVQRAVVLNHGMVEVQNCPGHGCIFRIKLPKKWAALN